MYELPKSSIIRNKFEFNRVYSKGRSYVNHMMIIHVINSDKVKGKIGFAVGKKIGNAVIRNRIKRLMREAYRISQHEIDQNVSMILIARKPLIDVKSNVVQNAFINLCKKAKILKRRSTE